MQPRINDMPLKSHGSLAEIKRDLAAFLKEIFSSKNSAPLPEKPSGPEAPRPESRLGEISAGAIQDMLEQPRAGAHGHLALPVFRLPKDKGQTSQGLAAGLAEKIRARLPPFLRAAEAVYGFVNFTFREDFLRSRLLALLSKKRLGFFESASPERWVMDFASPNVAKHINVGHLRAAAQGQALANLARRFGCQVMALNHLGDWGSQFGKLLWAWKAWGREYDFEKKPFESLTALYTRFYKEAESDPKKLKEATDLFQKLEGGDPELKKLWRRFADLSLADYDRYWKILGVKHDKVLGESFYARFLSDLKSRLREKNLLKKSEGAEAVFLKEGPPCLITKSDGASTYSARDLCAAIYRFEKWKADQNIYITGSDQKLHFRQIFEVLGKLSPDWQRRSRHLAFGMYRFKGKGKMSSRRGQAVFLKDLLSQAAGKAGQIILARRAAAPDSQGGEAKLSLKERQIAEQVGIGALIFNDLMSDRIKDVDFEWERILDFEGQSGPFVQYSHVRCLSLLRKYGRPPGRRLSPLRDSELDLAWRLLCFEEAALQSFKLLKPHILARYLLSLAGAFNRFYSSNRILGTEKEAELMLLVDGVRRALSEGLQILNVPQPEAM